MLRAGLLQVEDESYVFYFNMHHIISDGWSMEVLSKDVFTYYEGYKENKEPALAPLRIQYKDYSAWQLSQLKEDGYAAHRAYWLKSLEGELPLLDLPGTKHRPVIKTHNGHGLSAYIDSTTTGKLKKYTQDNGGSLFMGLLAGWNVLMYRYTSQTDIIIGSPIAGREHADLEDQIGFYVNTLALRNEIRADETFNELFLRVKQNTLNSYTHQMYPFDRLVEELTLQRDTSRSAVFDVMLVLQNNGEKRQGLKLNEEELNRIVDLGNSVSKFDIEISFQETGDYLSLQVIYNPDVYEQEMVEGLITHYRQLVNGLLTHPEEKVSKIDYLSEKEKQQLLFSFNDTKVDYPKEKTVIDLFEEQVKKTPDNIAVVFEEKELSYRELNEKSNQLADYLRKNYAIQADDLVGIKQERCEWMIISVLGVLKSGGAYVPIDPGYPQERIEYIEKDINYKVCIDENELSKFKENQESYSKKNVASGIRSNDLAYVIYTSGSTGRPKGVMLEHSSLVSFMLSFDSEFGWNNVQKIAASTNLTFDISVLEIFGALCNGKELIILSSDELNDPHKFLEKIEKSKVEGLQITPSRLSQIYSITPGLPKSISSVLIGGEILSEFLYNCLKKESFKSINVYGPTETTIWSTSLNIKNSKKVSIGSPLPNEQVYILNNNLLLQPIGVTGEICIGGSGLARGYLNQEELTQDKFISNPFKKGERLYRTGDLARWLSDGNIEYIGRKDDQVKIRGYRIELGEIEYAMLQIKGIKQSCVLVKERKIQTGTNKYLVGYYVLENKEEAFDTGILDKLMLILPDYMVPSTLVQMDAFPLTVNGKLDKRSLPDPDFRYSSDEYIAPNTEMENALCKVWEEILGLTRVGITDNFFRIGGNSILAVQMAHRMSKMLLYDIKVADVFRLQSISKMLEALEQYSELVKPYHFNYNDALADLIFIPPGRAGAEMYQYLAENLKAKFNCIGIDNYNIHSENKIDSLNKLASQYLSLYENKYVLKETVNLLGWSLGGLIAMEMAAILESKGYTKINVILLDTFIQDEIMKEFSNPNDDKKYIRRIENEMLKKYERLYVEKVLAAMNVERKIGNAFISNPLKHTHVVLFKATQKKENQKNKSDSGFVHDYMQSLSANNIDLAADKVNVINLDCHHENIIETQSMAIREHLITEEISSRMAKNKKSEF